jgi:hypothetical protein
MARRLLSTVFMRKLIEKLQALLTAAAFAEEGDVETARRMVLEAEGERQVPPAARRVHPALRPAAPRAPLARGSRA